MKASYVRHYKHFNNFLFFYVFNFSKCSSFGWLHMYETWQRTWYSLWSTSLCTRILQISTRQKQHKDPKLEKFHLLNVFMLNQCTFLKKTLFLFYIFKEPIIIEIYNVLIKHKKRCFAGYIKALTYIYYNYTLCVEYPL